MIRSISRDAMAARIAPAAYRSASATASGGVLLITGSQHEHGAAPVRHPRRYNPLPLLAPVMIVTCSLNGFNSTIIAPPSPSFRHDPHALCETVDALQRAVTWRTAESVARASMCVEADRLWPTSCCGARSRT